MVKKSEAETEVVEQPAPAAQKKKDGPKVGGLFRHVIITAIAVLAAMIAGMGAINHYVVDASSDEQGKRLADVYASQFVGFYNQVFTQAARQVGGIAEDDSLAAILVAGNAAEIEQRAQIIATSLAREAQVFLVTTQSAPAAMSLGFAAQDMLERAQRGEPTSPEVIPLAEHPLMLMAATIRTPDNAIVGAILVAFELNAIAEEIHNLDAQAGYMTLQQRFSPDEPATVVMMHGNPVEDAAHAVTQPTVYPNLTVTYTLSPASAVSASRSVFIMLGAATAILVVVAVVLSTLLLRRALQRNTSMLMHCAESLIQRKHIPVGIVFTLDIFEEAAASLRRAARQPGGDTIGELAAAETRAMQSSAAPAAARASASADADEPAGEPSGANLPDEIFRAYDIRGVVGKTLTEDAVKLIGKAIGSEALEARQSAIYVGRDGRMSGPQLLGSLIEGITSTGCNVINIGMVPTPLVYFATTSTATKSGVALTGSHNPAEYNGLKIVINGETLSGERIKALRQRILENNFRSGTGSVETLDIAGKYNERIRDDIVLARSLKVVVDCGNGVAGAVAPALLESLGCQVIPLYCEVDGNFPNHHPDPGKPDNLNDLVSRVLAEKADLGIAFDGDGDRIGVVTPEGKIIWPDRLMMLFARDILMRSPGADIIFDVKCTRDLPALISQHGGRPIMWRTGHSLIKAKLKETGAVLAGEMSGHIFFNDRWPGFDDAIYAAARLLEILSLEVAGADEVFAEFPSALSTPELHLHASEESKFRIVEALQKNGQFPGGSVSTIDGVRVDYPNGWGLVRASNTTPSLVARFEGRSEQDLEAVRAAFREQLQKVEPALRITF